LFYLDGLEEDADKPADYELVE